MGLIHARRDRSVATGANALGLLAAVLLAGIPSAATADQWQDFDHFRTRFPLVGAHEFVSCEECHRGGLFEGTPTRCALCHDGTGFRAQTSRDINHIISTNDCDDCHLMNAWVPSRIDHGAVRGTCFQCHNGNDAQGKNPGHVTSSNDCEQCHRTSSWSGAYFNHSGITAPCIMCHDNVTEPGKPMDHPMTSNDCEECHNTRDWSDVEFDHSGITQPCSDCHEKNSGHIISSNDCEECHNTNDWEDAEFDHSMITTTCATCHSGDVPSGHFMSPDDCGECHTTTDWRPDTFSHTSMDYPGDHAGNLDCTDCHTSNTPIAFWDNPEYQPDCAGCHVSEFMSHEHKNKLTNMLYTVSELRDCTMGCHVEDDGSPEHRVNSGEW